MIAVRIGPDLRMIAVSAPSYFANHPKPKSPNGPTRHERTLTWRAISSCDRQVRLAKQHEVMAQVFDHRR